jgi:hypothetical protein
MASVKRSQYPSALYFIIDDCEIHVTPKPVEGPTIPCTGRQQKLTSYQISYNKKFAVSKKWKAAFSELPQMSKKLSVTASSVPKLTYHNISLLWTTFTG